MYTVCLLQVSADVIAWIYICLRLVFHLDKQLISIFNFWVLTLIRHCRVNLRKCHLHKKKKLIFWMIWRIRRNVLNISSIQTLNVLPSMYCKFPQHFYSLQVNLFPGDIVSNGQGFTCSYIRFYFANDIFQCIPLFLLQGIFVGAEPCQFIPVLTCRI